MKALLLQLTIVAVALGVCAAGAALEDRSTFVPPPEAVVENFMRSLAAGRHEPARQQLDDALAGMVDAEGLRAFTVALTADRGPIRDVHGRDRDVSLADASALARLTFEDGSHGDLLFHLTARQDRWRIARLPPPSSVTRD